AEQEQKEAQVSKDERKSDETDEAKSLNRLKKEFYTDLKVAVEQIWGTQLGEEVKTSNYQATLLSHQDIVKKEILKFIKDELGVLPSPNSHFIYPMERHPGARRICRAVMTLAAIAGIEMHVYSANYKPNSPKATQKGARRNSDGDKDNKAQDSQS